MTIYLAGSWANRKDLRPIRDKIVALGHTVNSKWIDIEEENEDLKAASIRDIDGILESSLFIVDTDGVSYGKIWEAGFAYANERIVWIIGKENPTCLFFTLANAHLANWNEALQWLEDIA